MLSEKGNRYRSSNMNILNTLQQLMMISLYVSYLHIFCLELRRRQQWLSACRFKSHYNFADKTREHCFTVLFLNWMVYKLLTIYCTLVYLYLKAILTVKKLGANTTIGHILIGILSQNFDAADFEVKQSGTNSLIVATTMIHLGSMMMHVWKIVQNITIINFNRWDWLN